MATEDRRALGELIDTGVDSALIDQVPEAASDCKVSLDARSHVNTTKTQKPLASKVRSTVRAMAVRPLVPRE